MYFGSHGLAIGDDPPELGDRALRRSLHQTTEARRR